MSDFSTASYWIEKSHSENDPDTAMDFIDKALEIDSKNPDGLYLKCMLLYKKGDYNKAYSVASKMIEVRYRDAEAWYARGLISEKTGRIEFALKCYKKSLTYDPLHRDALFSYIELQKTPRSIIHYYRTFLSIEPSNIIVWNKLIKSLINGNSYFEALNEIEKAKIYHFNNAELNELEQKTIEKVKQKAARDAKEKYLQQKKKAQTLQNYQHEKVVKALPRKNNPLVIKKEEPPLCIEPGDVYSEWDSPAPVTIYCRMYNIPYSSYKYYRTRSSSEIKIKNIEDHLNSRNFNCTTCSFCLGNICKYKKKYVFSNSICKHFSPRKGLSFQNICLSGRTKSRIVCKYCSQTFNRKKHFITHLKKRHSKELK